MKTNRYFMLMVSLCLPSAVDDAGASVGWNVFTHEGDAGITTTTSLKFRLYLGTALQS
jgi:hypothetical protein